MRVFLGKFLQLSGMATLAGALMAGMTEPTLWNELLLLLVGMAVFGAGWLVERAGRPVPRTLVPPAGEPISGTGRSTH
jgi:hypothetical protein